MIARPCFILLRKEINFEPGFRSGQSAIGKKIARLSWQELPDFILSRHHFEKPAVFVRVYLLYSNFKRPDDPHCCSANGKRSCSTPSAGPSEGAGAIDGLRAPDWLAPWIPPELALAFTSMLSASSPAIEAALDQASALAGGLSVAVGAAWGLGSVLIVILGLVCSRLITALRRRPSAFASPSMGPAAAD
jgi:hypothetical protein